MLAFEWVSDLDSAPETVVMLHGILGRRRNLFGFARRFVKAFPHYQVLLVDIRNHGDSQGFTPPHTLDACAKDLRALFEHLSIKPRSLVGHSFGAGVAFTYAQTYDNLQSLWLLDAVPAVAGKKELDPSVNRILHSLDSSADAASKKEFEGNLLAQGIAPSLVSWLAMNLAPNGNRVQFRPHPQTAREMVDDFCKSYRIEDFNNPKTKTFLIRAERNEGWNGPIASSLSTLISTGKITVFDLARSGHFVHVDNPQGIIEVMTGDFA